jgi:hypothetical protein
MYRLQVYWTGTGTPKPQQAQSLLVKFESRIAIRVISVYRPGRGATDSSQQHLEWTWYVWLQKHHGPSGEYRHINRRRTRRLKLRRGLADTVTRMKFFPRQSCSSRIEKKTMRPCSLWIESYPYITLQHIQVVECAVMIDTHSS